MKRKLTKAHTDQRFQKLFLLGASLLCAVTAGLIAPRDAKATPGLGVTAEPMAVGSLPESYRAKLKVDSGFGSGDVVSDIAVVKFTIAPGGYFGWHRHGGPVWVVVDEGILTLYDPDVPGCAQAYGPGSAFLDIGDHVHNARNEGTDPVVVYGTFMLPEGAALRVDAPDPGICVLPPL